MTARPHLTRRRRGKGGRHKDAGPAPGSDAGAAKGLPRYLARPKAEAADIASAPEREARQGPPGPEGVTEPPIATPLGRAAAAAISAAPDAGARRLDPGERAGPESATGTDFSDVRVVPGSPLAPLFGAEAITYGDQIHLAGAPTADLMRHELTHVAQQRRFGAQAAQFRIATTSSDDGDSGLGQFEVAFDTRVDPASGSTGMDGAIRFMPYDFAPYSNRIGLIQTADVEEIDKTGSPDYDWSGSAEANREQVKNSQGSFVDMLHGAIGPEQEAEPWYWGDGIGNPDLTTSRDHYGWNRAPEDREAAQLGDFPKWNSPARFTFETVAKGRDNDAVYGAVRWGFQIDGSNLTSHEFLEIPRINTSGSGESYQSEGFDAALAAFRDFYVHEPEILYFGFDEDLPSDSELAKLTDAGSYMAAHPDEIIELSASADLRGASGYNRALALRRMNAVETHLLGLGISPDRIQRDETGAGESSAEGSRDQALQQTEGSFQANRRVTVRFRNTSSRAP